jgi:hypothetical protein
MRAAVVAIPSLWYEAFPKVILEPKDQRLALEDDMGPTVAAGRQLGDDGLDLGH